jgi:hypothetical protein
MSMMIAGWMTICLAVTDFRLLHHHYQQPREARSTLLHNIQHL